MTPKKAARKKITEKSKGLNENKRKEIVAILSIGCSMENAAKFVKCSPATIRNEIKNDETFAAEVKSAEQQSEVYFLQKIRAAANKDQYWRAAAWALERRCPNRYAPRGAKTLSEEQVIALVRNLVEIVVPEVHDRIERIKILNKVHKLIKSLDLSDEQIELPEIEIEGSDA